MSPSLNSFGLLPNAVLSRCFKRTEGRQKCDFPFLLVRKYKLILITQVGTEAAGSDLILTYFSINNFNWLRSILLLHKHFMFNCVYWSFLVTPISTLLWKKVSSIKWIDPKHCWKLGKVISIGKIVCKQKASLVSRLTKMSSNPPCMTLKV